MIDKILAELDEQIDFFRECTLNRESIGDNWLGRIEHSYKQLKDNPDSLINFRRNNLVVTDIPCGNRWPQQLFHKFPYFIHPVPAVKYGENIYNFIREHNLEELVRANPISDVGHPLYFEKDGMRFTFRWIRHIWFLSLFNKHLAHRGIKTILDIGGSYAPFLYLIKQYHPDTHLILIDLPEQVAAARYFLSSELPDARIASFKDIRKVDRITKDFVDNYDFILVPCFYLEKLEGVDLVTNFVSLPEMSREWQDHYLQSKVFRTAKFLFTVNRVSLSGCSAEGPDGLGLLDMPLNNYKRIHFDVCPYFKFRYGTKRFWGLPYGTETLWFATYYEYIGERK